MIKVYHHSNCHEGGENLEITTVKHGLIVPFSNQSHQGRIPEHRNHIYSTKTSRTLTYIHLHHRRYMARTGQRFFINNEKSTPLNRQRSHLSFFVFFFERGAVEALSSPLAPVAPPEPPADPVEGTALLFRGFCHFNGFVRYIGHGGNASKQLRTSPAPMM